MTQKFEMKSAEIEQVETTVNFKGGMKAMETRNTQAVYSPEEDNQ
jgi:hypothetical protein